MARMVAKKEFHDERFLQGQHDLVYLVLLSVSNEYGRA